MCHSLTKCYRSSISFPVQESLLLDEALETKKKRFFPRQLIIVHICCIVIEGNHLLSLYWLFQVIPIRKNEFVIFNQTEIVI